MNNDVGNLKVPAGFTFTKIDVEVSTGNIEILSKVNNLNIETSTGDVKLSNLSADNINVETSTGKHTLENINVTNQIKLDTSTGTVTLKSVNLATLRVAISTGRVNLTDVVATNSFNINSSTGRVSLENVMPPKFISKLQPEVWLGHCLPVKYSTLNPIPAISMSLKQLLAGFVILKQEPEILISRFLILK